MHIPLEKSGVPPLLHGLSPGGPGGAVTAAKKIFGMITEHCKHDIFNYVRSRNHFLFKSYKYFSLL